MYASIIKQQGRHRRNPTGFSEQASFNAERTKLTLTLQDGGPGDADNKADGMIHDPSGLGIPGESGPSQSCLIGSLGSGQPPADRLRILGIVFLSALLSWVVLGRSQR